jgi:hypothetical protein
MLRVRVLLECSLNGARAGVQAMLTAVCAFAESPKTLVECRAAEERAREELAAVRAAAAAAATAGAHGLDPAVAAAASAVAKAPEPRSAVVEAELWRVCYIVQHSIVLCVSRS